MRAELLEAARLDTAEHAPRPLAAIEADAVKSRPGMRIVETTAARLRVRHAVVPGAPTLVILPDGPNGIEQHDPVFARFEGRLSVLAIEIPGFGFSYATDPVALTFEGCVAACGAGIEALGVGDLILTGSCIQAYVAIALAAGLPDRTLGVVAAQATDLAGERHWIDRSIDPHRVLRQPGAGQRAWSNPAMRRQQAVERWYRVAAAPGFDVSGWQATAHRTIDLGCSNALASVCQLWFTSPKETVPIYDGPSIILFGTADGTHAAAGSDPAGLKAFLPMAELRLLDGAGHFPDLEDLDAFEAAVGDLIFRG